MTPWRMVGTLPNGSVEFSDGDRAAFLRKVAMLAPLGAPIAWGRPHRVRNPVGFRRHARRWRARARR